MSNFSEKSPVEPQTASLETVGGQLWIDFANTFGLEQEGFGEFMGTDQQFRDWASRHHIAFPTTNDIDLSEILRTRERIHALLVRMVGGEPLTDSDVDDLNGMLQKQRLIPKLHRAEGALTYAQGWDASLPVQVLGPIVDSLARAAVNMDPQRLRKCEHPDCVLYFYDDSKSGRRRWCSMAVCGNRTKAAAHYRRIRRVTAD